jgi:hypothetical protein
MEPLINDGRTSVLQTRKFESRTNCTDYINSSPHLANIAQIFHLTHSSITSCATAKAEILRDVQDLEANLFGEFEQISVVIDEPCNVRNRSIYTAQAESISFPESSFIIF